MLALETLEEATLRRIKGRVLPAPEEDPPGLPTLDEAYAYLLSLRPMALETYEPRSVAESLAKNALLAGIMEHNVQTLKMLTERTSGRAYAKAPAVETNEAIDLIRLLASGGK